MQGLSGNELDKLRNFDTPTICNAIELYDVRPRNVGYMDRSISASYPELPPMVGYASTATCRGAAPAQQDSYATLEGQVALFDELPGPVVVVYQDLGEPPESATFGDVMCTAYKAFGAVGLVTNGAARDVQQIRALEFPTFSNGAICSHGYVHTIDFHVPVYVGRITVFPGDLLHGDCNGVTTIPNEVAADLGDVTAEYVAAEEVVLSYLKGGNVTTEGLAKARAEGKQLVAALAERVRKSL